MTNPPFLKVFEVDENQVLIFIEYDDLNGYWVYLTTRINGQFFRYGNDFFEAESAQKAIDEYTQEKAEKWYFRKKKALTN